MPLLPLLILAAAQKDVAASPEETKPLKAGAPIPAAKIRTIDGVAKSLTSLTKGRRTVLVFYRGGWCPYCNLQLSSLASRVEKLKALGYGLIAISPDLPAELKKSVAKNKLSYTLVSDARAEAIRAFGLAFRMDDATFETYKSKYGIDLEKSSGEKHHLLPVPAVFLVNRDNVIRYAFSNPDYRVRLDGDELLAAAKKHR